jgi:5-carboxymethyl-2-hydroxymuconate isomerase
MPHCILEYSVNVVDEPDFRALFGELHQALVAKGEFNLGDIKSRAIARGDFLIAEGDPDRSFVALEIRILEGRSDAVKSRISSDAAGILRRHLPRTLAETRCSLSVQVTDVHRASSHKEISGR